MCLLYCVAFSEFVCWFEPAIVKYNVCACKYGNSALKDNKKRQSKDKAHTYTQGRQATGKIGRLFCLQNKETVTLLMF